MSLLADLPDLANLGAVAVIAVFAVKEFFAYLSKKSNGSGGSNGPSVIKVDLGPLHQKLDALLKADAAGQKTSDWWELTFARIFKQCLMEHENQVRRAGEEEATEMRQHMLDGLKQIERQIALGIAEVSRQIRDKGER